MLIGGKTVEHFDESEVREIEIDDRNYPELLKSIKKPPKALRVRVNLPPNRKFIAISGSRETTQQALDAAYRIGKMHAQHGYTVVEGRAVIITRYVAAKIEGATIVKNTGELKDALDIDRERGRYT